MTNVSSWICQKCLRVYSTLMLECDKCNLEVTHKENNKKKFEEPIKKLLKCERCGKKVEDMKKHMCVTRHKCFSCGLEVNNFDSHVCRFLYE